MLKRMNTQKNAEKLNTNYCNSIDIVMGSEIITVEIITQELIPEMAELDRRLFGVHKALSEEELGVIYQHGKLLAIRDEFGQMIAEAQVLTSPIPDADEPLVQVLPESSGYREGSAVDNEHRGKNLGVAIARAAEVVMRAEGKRDAWGSVRIENAASIRNLTKEGFLIIGYCENYYQGEGLEGARIIVRKDFQTGPNSLSQLDVSPSESLLMTPGRIIEDGVESIKVPVVAGDAIDPAVHQMIKEVLSADFIGIGMVRDGSVSAISFVRQDSYGDVDAQESILEGQRFLRTHQIA